MGNNSSKDSRGPEPDSQTRRPMAPPSLDPLGSSAHASPDVHRPTSRSRNRVSRPELSFLGLGNPGTSGSHTDAPYERRETKQEREARRLEREKVAREKERERSMREEHIDGGFLVTLGTYTGIEDFNKPIVRQLQIERRLAPFWRGLNDHNSSWTDYQLVSAVRGLPIPRVDATPLPGFMPRPHTAESPAGSSQNLNNLTVPMGPRSMSAASDKSVSLPGSTIPSPVTAASPNRANSPFKPRAKAIAAALSVSSRNGSQTDITPREINLPHEPFVNGQPIEVVLYKEATDCPICFLSYPPYLNRTRCCDQPICSECFVQIKRPDPHPPENHGEHPDPNAPPPAEADALVSEPACCPYCQQPEFGVTYEAPPFRRGLAYSIVPGNIGAMNTAMSSSSSLNSNLSPTSLSSPSHGSRRRTQSLSVNAPNVITTDRIRPDWATKLAAQRAHIARRAAAATALHTAAFLMGNADSARSFGFARHGRFSRRNTGGSIGNNGDSSTVPAPAEASEAAAPSVGIEPGPRVSSGGAPGLAAATRRSRLEDLEEMMMLEAVRLSLAEEERRQQKADKEARKEAKKKEKDEKKASKTNSGGGVYGTAASGPSSASGSSLSLGLGRRRGNSGASNLRVEASVASALQQKSSPGDPSDPNDKGKGIDRGPMDGLSFASGSEPASAAGSSTVPSMAIPTPPGSNLSRGPSHLRQMSSASSVSSSLIDSAPASFAAHHLSSHLDDHNPRSSGLSLGGRSEDGERDAASSGPEPLFNFRSLAEMVGVQLEGEDAGTVKRPTAEPDASADARHAKPSVEHVSTEDVDSTAGGLSTTATAGSGPIAPTKEPLSEVKGNRGLAPPQVMVTPETPAAVEVGDDAKQLGHDHDERRRPSFEITQ